MAFDWEVIVGVEITGVEKCDMVVAGTGFDTDWVTVKQGADTEQVEIIGECLKLPKGNIMFL